ncbi:hypothetical protein AB4Z54_65815, partial [Streptomyces sp. MCAF7]
MTGRLTQPPCTAPHHVQQHLILRATRRTRTLEAGREVEFVDQHIPQFGDAGPGPEVTGRGRAEVRQREVVAYLRLPLVPEGVDTSRYGAWDGGVQGEHPARAVSPRSRA